MRRSDWLMIAFILALFLSMGFAIISTASAHEHRIPVLTPRSLPTIQECELPLWDRIRYLCPQDGDNND